MKKHLLGIAAIIIAAFSVAFTTAKSDRVTNTDDYWYYTGADPGDHDDEELYEKLDEQDVTLCDIEASDTRCVIQAPELVVMTVPQGVPDLTSEPTVISFKPE